MTEAYLLPLSSPGAVSCLRAFPGEPGQVPRARSFVAYALAECPAREALLTCVSELAANAIAHTASGAGGVFTVEVSWPAAGVARVAVTDAGGPRGAVPAARQADGTGTDSVSLAEGGRGLLLVAACSSKWGYHDAAAGAGRTVWAEATWPVAVSTIASQG